MRLNNQSINTVHVRVPDYDRSHIKTGIIHLGVGAFHRGHQAVYVDDLLADDPEWGIVGASLRSRQTADVLNSQDGLYTLITKGGPQPEFRIIGSIREVISAAQQGNALHEHLLNPDVRIVTLTITEKGYCHVPATRQIDLDNTDIQHDISTPAQPRTAPGYLVAAIRERRAAGSPPFTVLSCDNLLENGSLIKHVVIALARIQDPALACWIEQNVTFPCTMVDRIVPAAAKAETTLARGHTGLDDWLPVVTEPFCQWVIEDNFCSGRPAFESAGATLTNNVVPFEKMKLRLLNGSHSALAYLGLLRGHATVDQAIADEAIRSFIQAMMGDEVSDTLIAPPGVDLVHYQKALLERFANPNLKHSLLQIASDGSQKLPQRILEPIRERMQNGQPFPRLAKVVAAWARFVGARDGSTFRFPINDPLESKLRALVTQSTSGSSLELLRCREIFGDDLSSSAEFREAVTQGDRHLLM